MMNSHIAYLAQVARLRDLQKDAAALRRANPLDRGSGAVARRRAPARLRHRVRQFLSHGLGLGDGRRRVSA